MSEEKLTQKLQMLEKLVKKDMISLITSQKNSASRSKRSFITQNMFPNSQYLHKSINTTKIYQKFLLERPLPSKVELEHKYHIDQIVSVQRYKNYIKKLRAEIQFRG